MFALDPVSDYSIPPRGFGRMKSILAGPDGRMWMTAGNQIYTFRL